MPPKKSKTPFSNASSFIFTDKQPRPVQTQAINAIRSAFASGKRFVILEGPPGVGKSAIGMTVASDYSRTAICTVSKYLQDQYSRDFSVNGAVDLKGRSTFECENVKGTCEDGAAIRTEPCPRCPYQVAKRKAFDARYMVANYHSFIHNCLVDIPDSKSNYGKADLLILDEAHEVEQTLLSWMGLELDGNRLPVYFPTPVPEHNSDVRPYWEWVESLRDFLLARMEGTEGREKTKMTGVVRKLSTALGGKDSERWILNRPRKGSSFSLMPLTAKAFGPMLFNKAQRVLLMSATIIDPPTLCRAVGIPKADAEIVTLPCIFPKENRPVYVANLNMTYDYRDQSWPIMVDLIQKLMDAHPDEKGLILTASEVMTKHIQQEVSGKYARRLIPAFGSGRNEMIRTHIEERSPTVLIGPGLWVGVDLKDDAARFQIVPQLPRPKLEGQVKARVGIDPDWYRWRTLCSLIQGTGRGIRHEEDHCVTYIFDAQVRQEMRRRDSMLPQWFKDAVQEID